MDSSLNANEDAELKKSLRQWRRKQAVREGLPRTCIFNHEVLDALVRLRPRTIQALLRIRGIQDVKVSKYGAGILKVINPNKSYETSVQQYFQNLAQNGAPKRTRNRWSEEEDRGLMELEQKGNSVNQLAEKFGRTEEAVESRLKKIKARFFEDIFTKVEPTPIYSTEHS